MGNDPARTAQKAVQHVASRAPAQAGERFGKRSGSSTTWSVTEHEELRSTHAYALTATDDVVAIGGCAGDPSRAFVWLADGPDDAALTPIHLDGTGQACVGALAIVPDAVIAGGSDDETAAIWSVDPTGGGATREDLPVQVGADDAWIDALAAFDGGLIAAGSMYQGGHLRGPETSAMWIALDDGAR